jgi:hypothetical protein
VRERLAQVPQAHNSLCQFQPCNLLRSIQEADVLALGDYADGLAKAALGSDELVSFYSELGWMRIADIVMHLDLVIMVISLTAVIVVVFLHVVDVVVVVVGARIVIAFVNIWTLRAYEAALTRVWNPDGPSSRSLEFVQSLLKGLHCGVLCYNIYIYISIFYIPSLDEGSKRACLMRLLCAGSLAHR